MQRLPNSSGTFRALRINDKGWVRVVWGEVGGARRGKGQRERSLNETWRRTLVWGLVFLLQTPEEEERGQP